MLQRKVKQEPVEEEDVEDVMDELQGINESNNNNTREQQQQQYFMPTASSSTMATMPAASSSLTAQLSIDKNTLRTVSNRELTGLNDVAAFNTADVEENVRNQIDKLMDLEERKAKERQEQQVALVRDEIIAIEKYLLVSSQQEAKNEPIDKEKVNTKVNI